MLTCCPQCGTTFRVSPQQLKVHQGDVRCGRCSTVFDAFDSLLAEPSESGAVAVESLIPVAEAPQPPDSPEAAREGPLYERRREAREPPAAPIEPEPAPVLTTEQAFAGSKKPSARWPWVVLSVLAVLGLAAQATYYYRNEIAAMWPETRPWLERACASLRCGVALTRLTDLVSIDASDLQVDPGHSNVMLLTATLKNRARFPQDYPDLALTLTDAEDKPLARRVLTPADYLETRTDSRAGFAANGELAVKVFIDSRDIKATGYRLLLFYP